MDANGVRIDGNRDRWDKKIQKKIQKKKKKKKKQAGNISKRPEFIRNKSMSHPFLSLNNTK
jgi:hypothetical protein